MSYDISQPIPQGSDGAQDAENSRISAITDELKRLCAVYEAQRGDCVEDVNRFEIEQRVAEQLAKSQGFWIPMMDVFNLGEPGPSGNENDTYVGEKVIYKVNNLLNCGSITALLQKILMHNQIFPDTAYSFRGFAGFDGRTVQPVIIQPRIANARPATRVMIDTYMAAQREVMQMSLHPCSREQKLAQIANLRQHSATTKESANVERSRK